MKKEQAKKDEVKELTETMQRIQADFENYKKQVEKRCKDVEKMACKKVIGELLQVLDSFELTLKNKSDSQEFVDGVELVYSQFLSVLKKEGLKPIEALGEKFDPYKHEALLKETSKEPEDQVIDEMQKGYTLNEEVIRFSKVKLSKGKKKEEKKND